ncbi:SE1561 family protein [Rossellomorea sp. NRS-1567]|uniref:SE1561 family protein n=1 Tax=Rossellomorea sp. NRS-1567 TaxID=3233901 RepID=UPI003D2E0239
MGKAINDKDLQVSYLKQRLNLFVDVLDSIDPEQADIDDIDRLIAMIDDIEVKCEQFKKSE